MKESNKKATILAVTGLIVLIIGVVSYIIFYRMDSAQKKSFVTEVSENMKKVKNYHLSLESELESQKLSLSGSVVQKEALNSIFIDSSLKENDVVTTSSIRYDFDLIEQRYLQNIYHDGTLIHTNVFSSTEDRPLNVEKTDTTHLLSTFANLLSNSKTSCNQTICTYSLSEDSRGQLLFRLDLVTFSVFHEALISKDDILIEFHLEKEKKEIQFVTLSHAKKEFLKISFDSFNKISIE